MAGRYSRSAVHGLLVGLCLTSCGSGLAITFCSPDNTGSDLTPVYNQFQSNGACQQTCQSSYAFAVLQGGQCWCSNYAPPAAYQENTLFCNQQCPGFGSDWCGSTSAGLYGYYQLALSPSGTAGASSSGASSSSVSTLPSTPANLSSSFSPVVATTPLAATSAIVTVAPPQTTVSSAVQPSPSSSSALQSPSETSSSTVPVMLPSTVTSSSRPQSSTFVTSTTLGPSSTQPSATGSTIAGAATTPAPTPSDLLPSVTTITAQGTVRTVVISPSATADPLGQAQKYNGGGGISPGKVAGIVVGVALGLAAIIGLMVWFWLRRKHEAALRGTSPDGTLSRDSTLDPSKGLPSRQMSQMSSSGLLGKAPRIQTAGLGPTNNPRSADTGSTGFDRRSVGTDQRLNPHALYVHDESRLSSVSLQDNQDYSRQLRVANPDQ